MPYNLSSAIQFDKLQLLSIARGMMSNMQLEHDITLFELIKQRFGHNAATYLVDTMSRGIFGMFFEVEFYLSSSKPIAESYFSKKNFLTK